MATPESESLSSHPAQPAAALRAQRASAPRATASTRQALAVAASRSGAPLRSWPAPAEPGEHPRVLEGSAESVAAPGPASPARSPAQAEAQPAAAAAWAVAASHYQSLPEALMARPSLRSRARRSGARWRLARWTAPVSRPRSASPASSPPASARRHSCFCSVCSWWRSLAAGPTRTASAASSCKPATAASSYQPASATRRSHCRPAGAASRYRPASARSHFPPYQRQRYRRLLTSVSAEQVSAARARGLWRHAPLRSPDRSAAVPFAV